MQPSNWAVRSLMVHVQGDGDSEIALVVEDEDMIESSMDGEPYQAGRFAATLRRKLYRGTSPTTSSRFLMHRS